mmetsp:Transcript_23167/g.60576  ORF Transcript_23167/g.60576 Transcript_23167/m.60576 type:complete len:180 (-) Transcript_23167:141-680(-)
MGAVVSTLAAPATTLAQREAKKTVHGALMIWSWGVFIPSAMMLAAAGKPIFDQWFKLHRALGVAGAAMSAVAVLLGRQVGSGAERATNHRRFGYFVVLIALAQPVIAASRPNPKKDPDGRARWYAIHKYLAWLALLLGAANIRSGLRMWDPRSALSLMYSSGVVSAGAVVAAWNAAALM